MNRRNKNAVVCLRSSMSRRNKNDAVSSRTLRANVSLRTRSTPEPSRRQPSLLSEFVTPVTKRRRGSGNFTTPSQAAAVWDFGPENEAEPVRNLPDYGWVPGYLPDYGWVPGYEFPQADTDLVTQEFESHGEIRSEPDDSSEHVDAFTLGHVDDTSDDDTSKPVEAFTSGHMDDTSGDVATIPSKPVDADSSEHVDAFTLGHVDDTSEPDAFTSGHVDDTSGVVATIPSKPVDVDSSEHVDAFTLGHVDDTSDDDTSKPVEALTSQPRRILGTLDDSLLGLFVDFVYGL